MADETGITNRQLITRETGIAMSIVIALLGATWFIARFTATIDNRLAGIEREVAGFRADVLDTNKERAVWAHRLAELNLELVVPDPGDPNLRPIKVDP